MRPRMISPEVFTDPYLEPLLKRLTMVGLTQLAEDSGCVLWDARTIRGALFAHEDVSVEDVQQVLDTLDTEDRAWTYRHAGKTYAYLPDFSVWNRAITRWQEPHMVPLPPAIEFHEFESKERSGSGRYAWPSTREDFTRGNEAKPSEVNSSELNSTQSKRSELKEPVRSQQAASKQAASKCKLCGGKGRLGQTSCPDCSEIVYGELY